MTIDDASRAARLALALILGAACARPASADVLIAPGVAPGLSPADVQSRYDATSVLAGGQSGRGTRIAMIAASDAVVADVDAFRARFGLPRAAVERRGSADAGLGTTVLLEWLGVLAPDATVTLMVGDPWVGFATAVLDNVAPTVVVPDVTLGGRSSGGTALFVVTIDGRRVGSWRTGIEVPDAAVIDALVALAETHGQAIIVPAGSALAGRRGVVAVGGTELAAGAEVVWRDQAGSTAPDPLVTALASPLHPGYAYVWQATAQCCAGGTELAAALVAGVAAQVAARPLGDLIADAGRRQAAGGIEAFVDVVTGAVPATDAAGGSAVAGPGFDAPSGWGSPRLAGLIAAQQCVGVDCGDRNGCTLGVCEAGGVCRYVAQADGTPCEDGDVCTVHETCHAGLCTAGEPFVCADGGRCTAATCEAGVGCRYEAREDGESCQTIAAPPRRPRCALAWVVDAAPSEVGARGARCTDGDPSCDHDDVRGQCTFRVNVCATPSDRCRLVTPRVKRPSGRGARRSSPARGLREALGAAVAAGAGGPCSPVTEVVVPVGRRAKLRVVATPRLATRLLRVACEAESAAP